MLATAMGLSALVVGPASGDIAKEYTPDDTVMAVTANLREAWEYGDTTRHDDMDKFVTRLLDEFKYRPDVLAVQEVRQSSAKYVAGKLSRMTGDLYKVVVMPPKNPYFPMNGRPGAKETSILINTATMKVLNNGGYIPTKAKAEHMEPHSEGVIPHQAHALLQKKGTDMVFATLSVHLVPQNYIRADLDAFYRNKWVKQLQRKLVRKYARRNLKYLAMGDYNQASCLRLYKQTCRKLSPFWKTMRYDFKYQDTLKLHGPVDFIFSKGKRSSLSNPDSGFENLPTSERYSDHVFRYAILGPDRYAPIPPAPFEIERKNNGEYVIALRWGDSDDRSGSGVTRFRLEKKYATENDWTKLEPKPDSPRFYQDYDLDFDNHQWVSYRVRAIDKAGNPSAWITRAVELDKSKFSSN